MFAFDLDLHTRWIRRRRTRLGCRPNADGAQWAERHGCRESAARTWMSVQRGPTERRRSAGTRRSRAQPGAGHFWLLLVPFKSDPPERRKGDSLPPKKTDQLTTPTPTPKTKNQKPKTKKPQLSRAGAFRFQRNATINTSRSSPPTATGTDTTRSPDVPHGMPGNDGTGSSRHRSPAPPDSRH